MEISLVVGLGIAGIVLALIARWRRRRRSLDLGSMSDQWVAEQQRTRGPDPNR